MTKEGLDKTDGPPGDAADCPPDYSANAIHLCRTAQINTLTLSRMADQKANILIGATFVVFSLSVTRLIGSEITIATISLALTAFTSSLFAVLAVLPTTKSVAASDPHFNVLFFGHFTQVDEEEWKRNLLKELEDDEAVFRTMLRDIYQNGQILHRRKYRFLGYAYRIFLSGLLITMIIYAAEYFNELA
ncbi:Pycsar system effector family protein [Erythrobacter sp. THAF29]|uniref:Pycsar system effector family protein n=1 Tax=Erythrobacter sp. THAF29 TaxID=2587851 RepID=UPI0012A87CDA|nr:Pycsar system effector family protein [Erythrobacter sp. THAF29]QFT76134.1 hypothetical protein FIU90_01130 [Erythrobacter sp. THAF29]